MKRRIQGIMEIVKKELESDVKTRNCDNYLYFKVCAVIGAEKGINLNDISMADYFLKIADKNFPSFESVSRCRRKLQEHYPFLVADEIIEAYRAENEKAFREMSRGVV